MQWCCESCRKDVGIDGVVVAGYAPCVVEGPISELLFFGELVQSLIKLEWHNLLG